MRKSLISFIIIFFCLMVFLVFLKIGSTREGLLRKNGMLATAYISDYEIGSKGSGTNLKYRFIVEEKNFSNSKRLLKMPFSVAPSFRDKLFPVIYLPNNPSVNTLLVTPDDYSKYEKPFPDSLNWIKKFLSGN